MKDLSTTTLANNATWIAQNGSIANLAYGWREFESDPSNCLNLI